MVLLYFEIFLTDRLLLLPTEMGAEASSGEPAAMTVGTRAAAGADAEDEEEKKKKDKERDMEKKKKKDAEKRKVCFCFWSFCWQV